MSRIGSCARREAIILSVVIVAAGVALGAFATYLFLRDEDGSRTPIVTITRSSSGALVGLMTTF